MYPDRFEEGQGASEAADRVVGRKQAVRVVMGFYEQPLHIATKEAAGIKSVMDLRRKRVSTGAQKFFREKGVLK